MRYLIAAVISGFVLLPAPAAAQLRQPTASEKCQARAGGKFSQCLEHSALAAEQFVRATPEQKGNAVARRFAAKREQQQKGQERVFHMRGL